MKKFLSLKNEKGFSLVELMIVVGIIGILSTLALPRFKQFQAKAKMGEAKNILSHLYTLQQTYALDNNVYLATPALGRPAAGGALTTASCTPTGNNATLGFSIDPCVAGGPTPRYSYSTSGIGPSAFLGQASSGAGAANTVCPGNAAHVFTVDQANSIILVGGVALPNPCIN